jgi:microcystin-dependent protein
MSDYYVGEVRLFAGAYVPAGWHLCDGSMLKINDYQALFAIIGVTYGGDGVTTFGIPDLRGRIPIGQGQGTGLTNRVMAQSGGAETVALSAATMGAHTHNLMTAGVAATASTPGSTVTYANTAAPTTQYLKPGLGTAGGVPVNPIASTMSADGPGAAHANVMPTAVLTYIIALNGTFPTRA